MIARTVLLALFVIALSACVPSATPVPPTPAAPTPIDYQRSGGFIGVQDYLTIDLNGHTTLTRRTGNSQFDLSRDELGAIQAVFQTAGFASIPENPTPQGFAADGFTYAITYQGHSVRTGDPSVPKQLKPVITQLNQIIDSAGK